MATNMAPRSKAETILEERRRRALSNEREREKEKASKKVVACDAQPGSGPLHGHVWPEGARSRDVKLRDHAGGKKQDPS